MLVISSTTLPKLWASIFLLVLPLALQAQPPEGSVPPLPLKKAMLRISTQNGDIVHKSGAFLTSVDEVGRQFKSTKAFSMELGWQMLGGREWHQTCHYPRVGIGAQYMRVLHRDEMGHPFSVYGFYEGNFARFKNLEFTNKAALGIALGFVTYDPKSPLPNDIISSKLNAFVELGVGVAARLSETLYLEPGLRFTHFSNGNTLEPQKGLNIASYSLGFRSLLARGPDATEPLRVPTSLCQHHHELLAFLGMSSRQVEFKNENSNQPIGTFGLNFLMANLHLGYNYEASHRLKLGGGVDLIYDGSNGQQDIFKSGLPSKDAIPFHDKIGLSVFVGAESVIDRLSIVTTLGYMVAQTRFKNSSPAFEQRLGFKYHFYRNLFAGLNVRAYNFSAAKTFEFHIGIRKTLR